MKRATISVDLAKASAQGEDRHPQVIVRLLCHQHKIDLVDVDHTFATGAWSFEVQTYEDRFPTWPPYIVARPHR